MQDDRAFKCSRCGNYEYETELAEKVCKNCASKAVESAHSASDNKRITKLLSTFRKVMVEMGHSSTGKDGNMIDEIDAVVAQLRNA